MSIHNDSMVEFLNTVTVALENALNNSGVAAYLAELGYTADTINFGKNLYNEAFNLHRKQQIEYAEKFSATDELNKARQKASLTYMKFIKLARIKFKDNRGVYTELGLSGKRKLNLSGWLNQAKMFYANLLTNEEAKTGLSTFGITNEKLLEGKALVDAVETAQSIQRKESGEAQQATKDRDSKIDELESWYSDFVSVARIALEEKPQYLEMFGIIEES
ncbi:MAG: hypothetical protein K9I99_00960 [Melioribacteraceae bacterium]|nr:hypothetical protein [Melioribacteraceae bacterium]MCF8432140.1 hypothetical protein [Melioribacteraceae bacterium]